MALGNQFYGSANMGSDMRRAQYQPGSINPMSGGGGQQAQAPAAPAWSNDNPMSNYKNSQQASNDLMGGQWMSSGSLGTTRQAEMNWTPQQKFFNGHVPGLDSSMFNQAAAGNQSSGVIQPHGAGSMPAMGGGGASTGVGQQLQGAMNSANAANEGRYQQLLGMSGQLSNVQSQREDRFLQNQLGRIDQHAISSGIGNSTVLPSLERGAQDDSQLRQQQIGDQGLRTAMGIVERRTDQGPDYGLVASLASRAGANGGGGFSGGPIGGSAYGGGSMYGGGAAGVGGTMGGGGRRFGSNIMNRPQGPDTVSGGVGQGDAGRAGQNIAYTRGNGAIGGNGQMVGDGLAPGLPPQMMQQAGDGSINPYSNSMSGGGEPLGGYDDAGNPLDENGMPYTYA